MMKMMKAIVKTRPERGAEYKEVPVPICGPKEVIVKVHATAICGTDIHIYQWNQWAQANFERAFSKIPRIMGHEFSGEVVEIGSLVDKEWLGKRVACETHIPCGKCYQCKTGDTYNCLNVARFRDGIYAEYAAVPAQNLVELTDSISYEQASILEPFSVATHGTSTVSVAGDTVYVAGCGPIGLFVTAIAKASGASFVYVSDISEYRRNLALENGADKAFDPAKCNVSEEVKKRTNGLGCGVVFETSGNVTAINQAFKILRKCGSMVMIGLPSKPLVIDDVGGDIVWKAAKIYGIHGREIFRSWELSKAFIGSGRVNVDKLITHKFSFADYEKAFSLAEQGLTGKVILHPEGIE